MFWVALRITLAYPCRRLSEGQKDDKAHSEIPNWALSFNKPREKQLNFQLNEKWKGDILNFCIGILSSLIFMEQEGMVLSSGFDAKVKQITLNL